MRPASQGESLSIWHQCSRQRTIALCLDFHVIVAYGVSISAVADNLIESVKYKVEEFTGIGG